MDLALIWALILAFAILVYVVLDGFDLGIGILFPFFHDPTDRDRMMNSIAPVWDGNETWLVLGGGGLFAAFPLAYAVLIPAFYPLIIAMLLALVLRGVAFEFRVKTKRSKHFWEAAFAGGSLLATLCQGTMLGAYLQEVSVNQRAYGGGWFDWLTPFSMFCGAALVAGYVLLGSTWLIIKTEGSLQQRCYRIAYGAGALLIAAIATVSLWLPLQNTEVAQRWFSFPGALIYWTVPFLLATLAGALFWCLYRRRTHGPYLLSLGFCLLSACGFGITVFPYIVPRNITLWEAAAPDSSLLFMLVGTAILLPMIILYTSYAYWVFRGKVRDEGYH